MAPGVAAGGRHCHVELMDGPRSAPTTGSAFHRAWMLIAVRGVLALAAAAVLLTRPSMGRGLLLAALGSYLFIDGMLALATALRAERGATGRSRYVLEGLVSITIGALAFARPMSIAAAVLMLIAARSIIAGLVEVATALSLRRSPGGEHHWPIALGGIASLGFGAFLLARPASGVLLMVLLAGLYLLVFGITLLAAGFRLRRAYGRLRAHAPA
jgi:uncharacterized membrane protein HdeD (DUF308 family)